MSDFYTEYSYLRFNNHTAGYFTLGGKLVSSLYRAVKDTILGILVGIIILSILLARNIVGNSTAALQLAAVSRHSVSHNSPFITTLCFTSLHSLPVTITNSITLSLDNCLIYAFCDHRKLIPILNVIIFNVTTGHRNEHGVRDVSNVSSRLRPCTIPQTSVDAKQSRLLPSTHSDARFIRL